MTSDVTSIRPFDNFAEEVRQHLVPIDSVEEWPDNPRKGDLDALIDSIVTNGFYTICAVQDSSNRVVAGNHRRKALMQLGATQVPVVRLPISDEVAMRIVLGDNRTSDLAFYDDSTLFQLLQALDGDFRGTGYDRASYELLLQSMEGEEVLGHIAQGFVPSDRVDAYNELDIRNVILPYHGSTYDNVAGGLIALRELWGYDTNADVVERLVHVALELQEAQ